MRTILLTLSQYNHILINGIMETFYMVGVSLFISILFGLPLGFMTTISGNNHVMDRSHLHKLLNTIINIGRSIPFVILMVAVIPFTRLITGTSIGTTAAIVPLSIAAIPFTARITDNALQEVNRGVIEAALAMGANISTIVIKVLLPEALPAIILGITVTAINLITYSAMAGVVGGGGLGDIAIRYGYQRFKPIIMIETIIIMVIMVQLIQWTGKHLAERIDSNNLKREN